MVKVSGTSSVLQQNVTVSPLLAAKITKNSSSYDVQLDFKPTMSTSTDSEEAFSKDAFVCAVVGNQKEGKSFLLRELTNAPFKVGHSKLKKTTEGVDHAVISKKERVEIMCDCEGWGSSETVATFESKLQGLYPNLRGSELADIASDLARKFEKKLGEFLYCTCDLIIVYSTGSTNGDVQFLNKMTKYKSVFKPRILFVQKGFSEEDLEDLRGSKMTALKEVLLRFRRVDFFSIPLLSSVEQKYVLEKPVEVRPTSNVEEFYTVIKELREAISRTKSLRVASVEKTLIQMKEMTVALNEVPDAPNTPFWVPLLSPLRELKNSSENTSTTIHPTEATASAQDTSPFTEVDAALEHLQKCFDSCLGLESEFDNLVTSFEKMEIYLRSIAEDIDTTVRTNQKAQVALSGVSAASAVGGAATGTAAVAVGAAVTAGTIVTAPVTVPILTAVTVATAVFGVGVGAVAAAVYVASEVRRANQGSAASTKLTKEQQLCTELMEKVAQFQVLEENRPHWLKGDESDQQLLLGLFFSFKVRYPSLRNRDIARKVLDSYQEVTSPSLKSLATQKSKAEKVSCKAGSGTLDTLYYVGKTVAGSAHVATGVISAVAPKIAAQTVARLGPKLATGVAAAVPILNVISVGVELTIMGVNAAQLLSKKKNMDAEQLRAYIPKVNEQLQLLQSLQEETKVVKNACLQLTEGIEKNTLIAAAADMLMEFLDREGPMTEARRMAELQLRRMFWVLYTDYSSISLEETQERIERIKEQIQSPAVGVSLFFE